MSAESHVPRCIHCGKLFDLETNARIRSGDKNVPESYLCSFHPVSPSPFDIIADPEAQYLHVWEFACCGATAPGPLVMGKHFPPPISPGCRRGPHEAGGFAVPRARGEAGFDVFLSFSHADELLARAVYDFLTGLGTSVFFSRLSLGQLSRADYQKAIDSALERARHMVVVTSSAQHVRSPWVSAEWGMFVNEQRSGRKDGNLITVIAAPMTIAELPITLRSSQVLPYHPDDFSEVLAYVT
jgi:hypothetical protein